MGWPVDLVLSPRGDLAVVQWQDQEESGLEFVALTSDGPRQIAETGLPQLGALRGSSNGGGFSLNSPLVFRPVFSPDGRYLLVPWQREMVWWSDEGGEYTFGMISVLDWQERTRRAIPLIEHVLAGWRPQPREDGGEGLLVEPPRFLDAERFDIALPTGVVRAFGVSEAAS